MLVSLEKKLKWHQDLEKTYYGKYPFGNCFQQGSQLLSSWLQTRDIKKLFTSLIDEQEQAKDLFDKTKAMEDFIRRTLDEYRYIMVFVREQNENVKMLDQINIDKVKKINEFLKIEDPRKDFRHIKKAYDEVKQALKDKLVELKKDVKARYEKIYVELNDEASKRNVEPSVYADESYILKGIENTSSLQVLKNKFLSADDFKAPTKRYYNSI